MSDEREQGRRDDFERKVVEALDAILTVASTTDGASFAYVPQAETAVTKVRNTLRR